MLLLLYAARKVRRSMGRRLPGRRLTGFDARSATEVAVTSAAGVVPLLFLVSVMGVSVGCYMISSPSL